MCPQNILSICTKILNERVVDKYKISLGLIGQKDFDSTKKGLIMTQFSVVNNSYFIAIAVL